jgi:hypothetical protein
METKAKLDTLGWSYIGMSIGWTLLLLVGFIYLHIHRNLPCLQIRRLPLLFAGVACLHIYGAASWVAYVIYPVLPCNAEFWMMSLYLPVGIAFFQAANSQFLWIAKKQRKYARESVISEDVVVQEEPMLGLRKGHWRRLWKGRARFNRVDRMMVIIGIAILVQVCLSLDEVQCLRC